jgi:Zinc knuckle
MTHEQVDACRHCGEQGHLADACPCDDREPDYGGADDGLGAVYSDADPGL